MRMAVDHARSRGASCLQRTVRDEFIRHYEALLGDGLAQNPLPPPHGAPRRGRRKQSPVRTRLDRLWTSEHEALLFLDDFAVPFDNNQAERDLRMVKVQQTVSGTFCSDRGADAFCRIRSVCSTWRKQGRGASRAAPSSTPSPRPSPVTRLACTFRLEWLHTMVTQEML